MHNKVDHKLLIKHDELSLIRPCILSVLPETSLDVHVISIIVHAPANLSFQVFGTSLQTNKILDRSLLILIKVT